MPNSVVFLRLLSTMTFFFADASLGIRGVISAIFNSLCCSIVLETKGEFAYSWADCYLCSHNYFFSYAQRSGQEPCTQWHVRIGPSVEGSYSHLSISVESKEESVCTCVKGVRPGAWLPRLER